MNTKKIVILISLLLLTSCGFKPLYSKKGDQKKYDFSINKIEFSGENRINQLIKNNLKNYLDRENKSRSFELKIKSELKKNVTSKNKKGDAETFYMEVIINLDVLQNDLTKSSKIFKEEFEYSNQSNKFNLNQYENNMKKNLTFKISRDIIFYVYSL